MEVREQVRCTCQHPSLHAAPSQRHTPPTRDSHSGRVDRRGAGWAAGEGGWAEVGKVGGAKRGGFRYGGCAQRGWVPVAATLAVGEAPPRAAPFRSRTYASSEEAPRRSRRRLRGLLVTAGRPPAGATRYGPTRRGGARGSWASAPPPAAPLPLPQIAPHPHPRAAAQSPRTAPAANSRDRRNAGARVACARVGGTGVARGDAWTRQPGEAWSA